MTTDDDDDDDDHNLAPLPLPVAGVWRREWEEDPLGDVDGADRDTLVLWTQSRTSGVYVDIRIPAELIIRCSPPCRDADAATDHTNATTRPNPRALAGGGRVVADVPTTIDRDRKTNALLLRQKSFAGVLRCTPGDTTDGTALRRDEVLASLSAEWRRRRINGDGDGKSEGEVEGGSEGGAKATGEDDDGGGDDIGLCTCYWRRDLDYQPPTGDPDVGVCASDPSLLGHEDGSTFLRETGADGSYAEGWRRIGGTELGPFMALRLISEDDDGMRRNATSREGCWVRAGRYFAYAVGRPTDAAASAAFGCPVGTERIGGCVGENLAEAVRKIAGGTEEEDALLRMAFAYVCVFGEIVDDVDDDSDRGGSGEVWRIRHSINPDLVGCHLVGDVGADPLCCSRLQVSEEEHSSSSEAHPSIVVEQTLRDDGGKRRWRVVELDGCDLPLS